MAEHEPITPREIIISTAIGCAFTVGAIIVMFFLFLLSGR